MDLAGTSNIAAVPSYSREKLLLLKEQNKQAWEVTNNLLKEASAIIHHEPMQDPGIEAQYKKIKQISEAQENYNATICDLLKKNDGDTSTNKHEQVQKSQNQVKKLESEFLHLREKQQLFISLLASTSDPLRQLHMMAAYALTEKASQSQK